MLQDNKKTAYFRFEASSEIGAGHAIRSGALADALVAEGWECAIITHQSSYDFIADLKRFKRIEPKIFEQTPLYCDLLVVDNYGLDYVYESYFRSFAKKIMVIDDLANRKHDCDILLDQTYGRDAEDYKSLVPENCVILAGSYYVLLRREFIEMRPKALEKRRKTTEIKRILISMGGSDPKNYTLKALDMIKAAGFTGAIDIVLGFKSPNLGLVENYIINFPNDCKIHMNADMPKLMYEADLAIGAAGTSVWERACLGLPQVLMVIADNQETIYENLVKDKIIFSTLQEAEFFIKQKVFSPILIDGTGVQKVKNFFKGEH